MRSIIRLFCRKETKREIEEFEKHEREKCHDEELQRLLKYNYIQPDVRYFGILTEFVNTGSADFKIVGAYIKTTHWGRDSGFKLPASSTTKGLILHHPNSKSEFNSEPRECYIELDDLKVGTERR